MVTSMLQLTVGIGKQANGKTLDKTHVRNGLNIIRKELSTEFGGYTELNSNGGWVNPRGELVTEKGKTFQVALMQQTTIKNIKSVAEKARNALNQESVLVIYNGKPLFV